MSGREVSSVRFDHMMYSLLTILAIGDDPFHACYCLCDQCRLGRHSERSGSKPVSCSLVWSRFSRPPRLVTLHSFSRESSSASAMQTLFVCESTFAVLAGSQKKHQDGQRILRARRAMLKALSYIGSCTPGVGAGGIKRFCGGRR